MQLNNKITIKYANGTLCFKLERAAQTKHKVLEQEKKVTSTSYLISQTYLLREILIIDVIPILFLLFHKHFHTSS